MSAAAPKRRIVLSTAGALAFAALVLITLVLPAEYGIDPLGTGAALGLDRLASTTPRAVVAQDAPFRRDHARFTLAPFESVEYKYRLAAGAAMLYAWRATGVLVYNLHSEPDGAEPGYAEGFDQGQRESANGSYVAPFDGIHGWFWENRTWETVTVELDTAGYYREAIEFRDGYANIRTIAGES